MCDYSLHQMASRPARIDDKLTTTKFSNSITRGFASIDALNVAVCLLPGTEIAFEKDVLCEPAFGFLPTRKTRQRVARFRHVNEKHPTAHHDALEFADGEIVLVTRLCEGQRATVLQLPASPHMAETSAEHKRDALVPERAF
jgi:hypothetical protein